MKIVSAILVCLFLTFAAFGQTPESENKEEISVEEITLFKDDGSGASGDEAEVFSPNDVPIHCSILLNSSEIVMIRMQIVAVKAAGIKTGAKIVTVNYKTNGKHNSVNFTASPADVWATGKYSVEIFVDGKLSASKEFEVTKAATPKL